MTEYVRVPREPTEAMLAAIGKAFGRMHGDVCYPTASEGEKAWAAAEIWEAMLAASPQGEGSSADTKRSEPDALPGDLRERVIGDLEALKVRLEVESVTEPNHVKSGVWWDYSITVDEAIALLIQSERGGA